MNRSAGILLPISSLPSPYGIGCFDSSAYAFVDFLAEAGQSYWQILPLGPTGYGDSPYQSYATFAGNPYYIDLEDFIRRGWLTREECDEADLQASPHRVDYERQYNRRFPLLRQAFERSYVQNDPDYVSFCEETPWLSDYTLFMALKDQHHGAAFCDWEEGLRCRHPEALAQARARLRASVDFYAFLQYHFYRQWSALKAYANGKGVHVIGDIPIYVAYDSADVWSHPELFQLDGGGRPTAVAGCPPDGFSADGQLWGNPLYAWPAHAETGYAWWIARLSHCFRLYDVVRIDHFRGFDEYYAIPYGHKTAREGRWEQGPGISLFQAVKDALGHRAVIAEDLGFITDSVRQLVRDSGFANMKVLEFAFDARDTGGSSEHMPHHYGENCVAYTGTHDNQTLASWLTTISESERAQVRGYLCDHFTPQHLLGKSLIALIMRSKARLCVVPLQDWLGLDDESRVNTPSTAEGNWQWRMSAGSTNDSLAREMRYMTKIYGR